MLDRNEKYEDSKDLLSDITIYSKYAKYMGDVSRREVWEEICMRNADMHAKRYTHISDDIYRVYARSVMSKKIVPSMRSLQFGGKAIEVNNSRIYNCAAIAMDCSTAFAEIMFLLLGGTGVGYSVQKHHVDKLNPITSPSPRHRKFIVRDDIMGWADCIKALVRSYFEDRAYIDYDFSEIRKKGTLLKTAGGRAPGPEPLKDCVHNIRKIMNTALEERGENTKLKPIEVHDICCHIANAVLAGGIRRSACIALFSHDDEEMMDAKGNFKVLISSDIKKLNDSMYSVNVVYKDKVRNIFIDENELLQLVNKGTLPWYHFEEQRGRSNNSVVLMRSETSEEQFRSIMKKVEESKAGEPGIVWTNDLEMLVNPCVEISLPSCGFCNLTEINASYIESEEDLIQRVKDAVFLGTLQAGYTEFHYLRDDWRDNAERDALLGVSFTGIASGELDKYDLIKMAEIAKEENKRVAELIGINPAKRIGTVKPAGTSSLVLKTSSGIHGWHSDYYIRRMRIAKDEIIYKYLKTTLGDDFVKDELISPKMSVLEIPIKAPEGAITRNETPIQLLERVKKFQIEWIRGSYREGTNNHNVSVTVSVKEDEWGIISDWMWENREFYNGISLLDFDGATYKQAPFEDINKETYEEMRSKLMKLLIEKEFDMKKIIEGDDVIIDFSTESACAGGSCELTKL